MRPMILLLLLVLLTGGLVSAQEDVYPLLFRSGEILDREAVGSYALYRVNPTNSDVQLFPGLPEGNVMFIEWSHDGSQIAFAVTNEVGMGFIPATLYVMNADGSNLRSLNAEQKSIGGVRWSPDDVYLAYSTMKSFDSPVGIIEIVSAADGSVQNSFEGYSFAWSPDGTWIAFSMPQPELNYFYDLFVVKAFGGEPKQLTDRPGNIESFAWHPAGKEITYGYYELPNNEREGDLYAIDPETGAERNVTQTGTMGATFAWSPDGTWLAFTDERSDFYLMNPEGHISLVAQNPQDGYRMSPPAWSPDGSKVAFELPSISSTLEYTPWTLHVADALTNVTINLSPDIDPEGSYVWSPDSSEIAFMGKSQTDADIFVVPADGSAAPRNLTNKPGFLDASPAWRPVVA